jgi:pimeloyl-ACP methyl ester carboxylesterase
VDFLIPQPNAVLELHMADGATIRLRRHGNKHGPRLVLSHGNGFAIDAYFPFWRLLVTDHDLILFDQRNHGHNPLHVLAHHTQWQMADDLEVILRAIASAFGERPIAGIFHSLSTTVSLLHSDRYGWPWDALILIDPPLAPAPDHPLRPLTSLNEIGLSQLGAPTAASFPQP